jgi:hypothetical protein
MIRDGELPTGDVCPFSGRPANETVYFDVQCERSWVRGGDGDSDGAMLHVLLHGWVGLLLASLKSRPRREFGRDTLIRVPLRISSDVREEVLRMRGQRKLKRLLEETPVYRELLREYPGATVTPAATV